MELKDFTYQILRDLKWEHPNALSLSLIESVFCDGDLEALNDLQLKYHQTRISNHLKDLIARDLIQESSNGEESIYTLTSAGFRIATYQFYDRLIEGLAKGKHKTRRFSIHNTKLIDDGMAELAHDGYVKIVQTSNGLHKFLTLFEDGYYELTEKGRNLYRDGGFQISFEGDTPFIDANTGNNSTRVHIEEEKRALEERIAILERQVRASEKAVKFDRSMNETKVRQDKILKCLSGYASMSIPQIMEIVGKPEGLKEGTLLFETDYSIEKNVIELMKLDYVERSNRYPDHVQLTIPRGRDFVQSGGFAGQWEKQVEQENFEREKCDTNKRIAAAHEEQLKIAADRLALDRESLAVQKEQRDTSREYAATADKSLQVQKEWSGTAKEHSEAAKDHAVTEEKKLKVQEDQRNIAQSRADTAKEHVTTEEKKLKVQREQRDTGREGLEWNQYRVLIAMFVAILAILALIFGR